MIPAGLEPHVTWAKLHDINKEVNYVCTKEYSRSDRFF